MSSGRPVTLSTRTLDLMMPMHLLLDDNAIVVHAGPTIRKVLKGDVVGKLGFSLFETRRPRRVTSMNHVRELEGSKIYLRLKDSYATPMIGSVAVLPGNDHVLLNLSFGYAATEAVARYGLAGSDFSPTELIVEMLYLVEAKTAAMEASNQLAYRLHDEKEEAQEEAQTDGLTGLRNRRAMDAYLEFLGSSGERFSVMFIDLDYFKSVNDTLGHAAGDLVLTEVARVLRAETRKGDLVARIGGDEFAIVLSGLTDADTLGQIANRIIEGLEKPIPYKQDECRISGSIGIVSSDLYDTLDIGRLNEDGDQALYASKRRGRACYTLFDPNQTQSDVRLRG